jgi:uncharacterized membrane protein YqjE
MENTSKVSLRQLIKNSFLSIFKLCKDTLNLAAAEAELAKKSLIQIACLSLLMAMLLVVTWIGLVSMAVVALVSFDLSWIMAFFIVTMLHVVLVIISLILMLSNIKNLSFPATHRQLRRLKNNLLHIFP